MARALSTLMWSSKPGETCGLFGAEKNDTGAWILDEGEAAADIAGADEPIEGPEPLGSRSKENVRAADSMQRYWTLAPIAEVTTSDGGAPEGLVELAEEWRTQRG